MTTITQARNTDPSTSHEAACDAESSGRAQRHRDLVLAALLANPGATSAELGVVVLDRWECARRLPDLRNRGLVRTCEKGQERICRVNGTKALTWWPTELAKAHILTKPAAPIPQGRTMQTAHLDNRQMGLLR